MVLSGEIYCIIPEKIECPLETSGSPYVVFKVGQSTQSAFKRVLSYGNKSPLLGRYVVDNPADAETKLLNFIRSKTYYKLFQGNEYFTGALVMIIKDFHHFMHKYIKKQNKEKQKELEKILNHEAYIKLKKQNEELKRKLELMEEKEALKLFETESSEESEESEESEDNEKMGEKRGRVNEELKEKLGVRAFISKKLNEVGKR